MLLVSGATTGETGGLCAPNFLTAGLDLFSLIWCILYWKMGWTVFGALPSSLSTRLATHTSGSKSSHFSWRDVRRYKIICKLANSALDSLALRSLRVGRKCFGLSLCVSRLLWNTDEPLGEVHQLPFTSVDLASSLQSVAYMQICC